MSVVYSAIEVTISSIPKRKQAQILERGMRSIAQEHRLVTMGKHFKNNAETAPGGAYGYIPRSARYVARKVARFGTDLPNVRTGRLRQWTRNNSVVTATQYKSTLKIKSPFPLNDQRRKELEAITSEEARDAGETGRKYMASEYADPKNQSKRKQRLT